jgi:hypothetical protein
LYLRRGFFSKRLKKINGGLLRICLPMDLAFLGDGGDAGLGSLCAVVVFASGGGRFFWITFWFEVWVCLAAALHRQWRLLLFALQKTT